MARQKKAETLSVTDQKQVQTVIAALPLEDLVTLKADVEHMIKQKQKEQKKEIYANMLQLAQAAGFKSVEDFVRSQKGRSPRSDKGVKMPPKFGSKDGSKTWSGKGRRPDWVLAHLKDGGQLGDLAID